jgi:hypothetical protein
MKVEDIIKNKNHERRREMKEEGGYNRDQREGREMNG